MHRDPALWDDPLTFDPDRFSRERSKGRNRWQYIPFGGGPRSCMGDHFAMLEATLALATIIRAVEISSLPGIYALSHQGVGQRCLTYRLIPRTPRSISQLGLRCRQSA